MVVWYSEKSFKISLLLGGKEVNIYLIFLKNLYEFSSPIFTGSCEICQLSVMKTLTNKNWSRGGGKVTYMRVSTNLLSKNITKQLFPFFASWRKLRYTSLLMLWISSICVWKTSSLWFAQVNLQNPIIYERAPLSAFPEVSFDRLIKTFYVTLNTANATHT